MVSPITLDTTGRGRGAAMMMAKPSTPTKPTTPATKGSLQWFQLKQQQWRESPRNKVVALPPSFASPSSLASPAATARSSKPKPPLSSSSSKNNNNAISTPAKSASSSSATSTTPSVGGGTSTDYRERLIAFYKKYNPSKLDTVDATLEKFKGKEEDMFRKLETKYVTAKDGMLPPSGTGPVCFLEFAVDGTTVGHVKIQLFQDKTPLAAENFRCLCTGEKGISRSTKPLWYKGSMVHRVVPGFCLQGGDFTKSDGTGGESIYPPGSEHGDMWGKFKDETPFLMHNRKGLLSMANNGPNKNGSQFFITLKAIPHLDGKHVVFGEVIEGQDIVDELGKLATDKKQRPLKRLEIVDCGQVVEGKEEPSSTVSSSAGISSTTTPFQAPQSTFGTPSVAPLGQQSASPFPASSGTAPSSLASPFSFGIGAPSATGVAKSGTSASLFTSPVSSMAAAQPAKSSNTPAPTPGKEQKSMFGSTSSFGQATTITSFSNAAATGKEQKGIFGSTSSSFGGQATTAPATAAGKEQKSIFGSTGTGSSFGGQATTSLFSSAQPEKSKSIPAATPGKEQKSIFGSTSSFGGQATTTASSFSFGPTKMSETKPAAPMFSFGPTNSAETASSSASNTAAASKPSFFSSFGQSSTAASIPKSDVQSTPGGNSAAVPSFSFGLDKPSPATLNFDTGKTAGTKTTASPKSAVPSFYFGEEPKSAKNSVPTATPTKPASVSSPAKSPAVASGHTSPSPEKPNVKPTSWNVSSPAQYGTTTKSDIVKKTVPDKKGFAEPVQRHAGGPLVGSPVPSPVERGPHFAASTVASRARQSPPRPKPSPNNKKVSPSPSKRVRDVSEAVADIFAERVFCEDDLLSKCTVEQVETVMALSVEKKIAVLEFIDHVESKGGNFTWNDIETMMKAWNNSNAAVGSIGSPARHGAKDSHIGGITKSPKSDYSALSPQRLVSASLFPSSGGKERDETIKEGVEKGSESESELLMLNLETLN